MFAALIPLAAQFLGPIVNNVLQGVSSSLTKPKQQDKSSEDTHGNFLQQQGNDLLSGIMKNALNNILGGLGSSKA